MAIIEEVIRIEKDDMLSFGDYSVKEKKKANNFELNGDLYNVKTHDQITRLEKNGKLLLESVPGAAVHDFKVTDRQVTFSIEGFGDTQVTMEMEPDKEYKILIDGVNVGRMKSNLSGKISFSAELSARLQFVKIEKV